jgi:hypothetical protein
MRRRVFSAVLAVSVLLTATAGVCFAESTTAAVPIMLYTTAATTEVDYLIQEQIANGLSDEELVQTIRSGGQNIRITDVTEKDGACVVTVAIV